MQLRKARQERLAGASPLDFWAIIEEPVLGRPVGEPGILRNQLLHLAQMAQRPNIRIQVLPLSAGIQPGTGNSFIVLTFPDDVHPDLVYLEHELGALYLEEPDEVGKYKQAFSYLAGEALDIEASLDIIRITTEELS